ncbi:MAG: hypothetical protein Q8L37_00150, partial [Candidatus Gottesmanbacteria bacterium]|nr:hypothetical protein [Candidatus Gottesmanbacteria bacterium]
KFQQVAANSIVGNPTGTLANAQAIATSSLFQNASASASGLLTSTDWSTFNNKQATISATWPIILTGAALSYGGLSTSTAAVVGNIPYFSGVNTFANVATTTLIGNNGLTLSAGNGYLIGGSNATIGLAALGSAGVLGAQTATVPTVQATSTLYGTGVGGQVLGWSNATNGLAFIATSTNNISSINIPGTTLSGAVTFATSSTAWNGLTSSTTITNSAGTLTFANTLAGLLGVGGGGTGLSSITGNRMLYTNSAGTALLEVATSSASFSIGGNAGTATALAVNGANCSAGNYPLGVDASGAVEDCTAASGGGAFAWTPTTYSGIGVNSTSTALWLTATSPYSLIASSTFATYASTTNFSSSGATWLATNGGSVGIGTTSPWAQLSINPNGILGPSFAIGSSTATNLIVTNGGQVGIGTAAPSRMLDIIEPNSVAQLRLSKSASLYSELTVDASGYLQISTTGGKISMLNENLWVCELGACPALTATSTSGNIFVENAVTFGNGFSMASTSNAAASELGLYDAQGNLIIIFDNQ